MMYVQGLYTDYGSHGSHNPMLVIVKSYLNRTLHPMPERLVADNLFTIHNIDAFSHLLHTASHEVVDDCCLPTIVCCLHLDISGYSRLYGLEGVFLGELVGTITCPVE